MMLARRRSSWVKIPSPRPAARLRLICLPYAGGGASAYRRWPGYLPDHVEVLPVQLPGREDRFPEPAIDSVDVLVAGLVDGLSSYLDRPFALFGHSMGALVAFELVRQLRPMGLEPVHFYASGFRAPHLPSRRPQDRHLLPDRKFMEVIRGMGGVPLELLENAEFIDLMLPTLRSDFKLVETYAFRPQVPLSCPISVFGGLCDDEVLREDLEPWSCHTTGLFQLHMLPGDHFFIGSSVTRLLRVVSTTIGIRFSA